MGVQVAGNENYFTVKLSKDNNVVARGWKINEVKNIAIIIHRQNDLKNGEIGMFMVNGNQIIKRYEKKSDLVFLTEPETEPIAVATPNLSILGKVVESRITL